MSLIHSIGIWIVSGIYHVAALAFELFLILANGELVSSDRYQVMVENFYIVIGIIMLFFLAFTILKGMVNPDEQKKGTQTVKKIIINLATSSVLMALLPTIFTFAFDFQDSFILNQNTIGKFFGYGTAGVTDNSDNNSKIELVKTGAFQIVNGVFTAFFNINYNEYCLQKIEDDHVQTEYLTYVERLEYCQRELEARDAKTFFGEKATKHTFLETSKHIEKHGSFGLYTGFAKNISKDEVDFNFLLSLIAGLLLIYVGVSFCFDMAIRLVKLVFYQLIAPIPLFMRVVPEGKFSDVFSKWLKVTLTCYLEVYIRIIVFYFCVFLCDAMTKSNFLSNEVFEYGIFLGLLAKAFVLMGVVTFMRQAPKIFSEVTGLDSGNMKLGIRDKLAQGGAFTAGAILGGGVTALTRNVTNAWANTHEKDPVTGKWKRKAGVSRGQVAGSMLKSGLAGGISGAVRSGKAGWNAKSGSDMKNAASSGAREATTARTRRAAYKSSHGGTIAGVVKGHITDTIQRAGEWSGVGANDEALGFYSTAAQSSESFNSMSEGTYKKKEEFIDQSSKVKRLEAEHKMALDWEKENRDKISELQGEYESANDSRKIEIDREMAERKNIIDGLKSGDLKDYYREKQILTDMQISMSMPKKDIIATAATRLAVDQKTNYSNDKDIQASYQKALFDAFGIKDETELSGNDLKIYQSFIDGKAIEDTWINESNIKKVQDAIDKANIGRQHIRSVKEREHIVKTGNRSTNKKDGTS